MTSRLRLGAVGYLNARPLVHRLDRVPRFDLRYDLPAECARLLHEQSIDLGLVPSIEYLRGPEPYRIVPDVAVASHGAVDSVAVYTSRPIEDVRSMAMDTSSRTSVALARVLCARLWKIDPRIESRAPNLEHMLQRVDAALIIGDNALLWRPHDVRCAGRIEGPVQKIDLGQAWMELTGLPFVYAFWAGRDGAANAGDVAILQAARDRGAEEVEVIAREYFDDSARQRIAARYLRDNIKCHLGDRERAALETFYRYASELGLAVNAPLRFF
jgi:chorismate dehydratase